MTREFDTSDEGKTVVTSGGDQVGTIASVDGDTANVEVNSSIREEMSSRLGWDADSEGGRLQYDQVDTVDTDEVRLRELD